MVQENNTSFGMRANREILDKFTLLAKSKHRTPAQLVREFMESYVEGEEKKRMEQGQPDLFATKPKG